MDGHLFGTKPLHEPTNDDLLSMGPRNKIPINSSKNTTILISTNTLMNVVCANGDTFFLYYDVFKYAN